MRPGRSELALALKRVRYAFFATAFFSLLINLLMLVPPLYMLQMYDRVLSSRSEITLIMLTILAAGMLGVLGLMEAIRSRVLVRVGLKYDDLLSSRVFSAAFRQAVSAANTRTSQSLRDLDKVREFMTGGGFIAFCDAPWVPIFLGIVFLFHPVLGLIALGGAFIIFCLALANELLTRKPLQDASQISAASDSFVNASLRNSEVVAAMHMLPGLQQRWRRTHEQVIARQAVASDRAGAILALSKLSRLLIQIAMLGAGAYLAILQIITPGTMIAASIVMARGLAPVEQAVSQWRNFIAARAAYGRLVKLFNDLPAEVDTLPLPAPKGHLSVQGVSAAPPGQRTLVLRNISFDLAPGEILGVVGPSAAGKSSLARVLVGVWKPLQGTVRLDGAELQHWNPSQLGRSLGYLPQDVELFDGTVAENIARFDTEAFDPTRVVEAAQKAGAHEMILGLAKAYDTSIGPDGQALSGGQRQRLGLARALYNDPTYIVLDEPNANLDSEGERALLEAMARVRTAGASVVVITHRPQILGAVDKILVLRNGMTEICDRRDVVLPKILGPRVVTHARTAPPVSDVPLDQHPAPTAPTDQAQVSVAKP